MTGELLPPDAGAADSPRLAWMKRHGIVVADRAVSVGINWLPEAERFMAWRDADRHRALEEHSAYVAGLGATQEAALVDLAQQISLPLWNEETATTR